ncbi:probable aspartic protease At2g35615 [Tripterygium wilfordii]|uniref:probable aspartic protease At2g35615 n=1 Tax=Tripterygium wilfordii TaxID=458696 RepID=UPI0018F85736|nr:probable aspartic protease At2g35615 [Tripterygium wilfordii]
MPHLILILILSLSKAFSQSLTFQKETYFSIDLIHRDSPLSPLYNPSVTQSELMKKAALRSLNRANFFHSSMHINDNKVMSSLTEIEGDYIMKIYIGSPPVGFLAIADTGSNLIWTQCASSNRNQHKNGKFFNTLKSTTYDTVLYGSEFCEALRKKWSGFLNSCEYNHTYMDGSYTTGILGNDTVYLNKTSNEVIDFHGVVFGCSEKNYIHHANFAIQGIVGLGPGFLSLISQLKTSIEPIFSYCLVPITSTLANKLRFGVGAKISGTGVVSTQLVPKDPLDHYYVKLESVGIGEKGTSRNQLPSNVMIDSGTTLTILHTSLYNDLKALVQDVIGGSPVVNPPEQFNLCYELQSINLDDLPEMVFHFSGADLHLKHEHTFTTYEDNLICMTIVPNDHISILGSLAQVNLQVEIDLRNNQVSFAEADCSTF